MILGTIDSFIPGILGFFGFLGFLGILMVVGQIYLFTGENEFALLEEKKRWIAEFRSRHGEEGLSRLFGRDLTARTLLDEVGMAPFIAEKRLVVVDGIPPLEKEEVQTLIKEIHPAVVLLCIEAKPDKRFAATKEFLKAAEVRDFKALPPKQLQQWLETFARQQGGSITADARDLLLQIVGTSQAMLAEEIRKLVLGSPGGAIGKAQVLAAAMPSGEQVAWGLTDLLGAGKRQEALQFAANVLERGENAMSLWNKLLWMLGNLVLVSSALAEGERSPAGIGRKTGLHPFSVSSLLPLARTLDTPRLRAIVDEAVAADTGLKTGVYRSTVEAPEEINALLDRLILHIG